MKTQVMIDIETLGTKPGSVIVALGAIRFDKYTTYQGFYQKIDAKSCVELGLKMDPDTVMWWLKQADEPRQEITKPGIHLSEALIRFNDWISSFPENEKETKVWGNGSDFDNVLLSSAYDAADIKRPWSYSNNRCYRTIKNLYPEIPLDRSGTHHNAYDDARDQALHLITISESCPRILQ